jgi:hypothetical protein
MVSVTPLEKAIDRFLLLYLISEASERVENFGDTKLQKFTFLSEWKMIDERDRGFCYFYLKYKKGPYSFDLATDIRILSRAHIIQRGVWELLLTRYGESIVSGFSSLLAQNPHVKSLIDKTIATYAPCSLQELLDEVYKLQHPYVKGYTIGTATLKMPLLYKLPDEKVAVYFKAEKEEAEDLLVSLSDNGLKHWQAVKDDMREAKYLTYKEVFGSGNR